jgi:hypothetical protein
MTSDRRFLKSGTERIQLWCHFLNEHDSGEQSEVIISQAASVTK